VPDEFSALVSTKERLIAINSKHHRHRQRFSVSHELGHILLHHPPESRCTPREIARYNVEADECAAELLMPSELLSHWYALTHNVGEIARMFDVSEEAMSRKIAQLFVSPVSNR
jgi:Zn-dependent peptidase ImmA (M78 family)